MSHIPAAAIRVTAANHRTEIVLIEIGRPTTRRPIPWPIACGSGFTPHDTMPSNQAYAQRLGPFEKSPPDKVLARSRHPDWSKCRDASLVSGFGRDELPVGIPRSHVARERPNV